MYGKFDCPECGIELKPKSSKCDCGWKKKNAPQAPLACSHDVNGFPCGRKADFNFKRADDSRFALCEYHFEHQTIIQSPDTTWVMARAHQKTLREGAKSQGLSNYEFLHEKKQPERVLKELLGWASHGRPAERWRG